MKILIDSDICLDFITGRQPYGYSARDLFSHIEEKRIQALVSPHSFSNMFYILGSQYGFSDIIPKLKEFRGLIGLVPLTSVEIDHSLESGWKDFEDAIQYHCAKESNCDAIITRNTDDYSKSELPVFVPFDFLNR